MPGRYRPSRGSLTGRMSRFSPVIRSARRKLVDLESAAAPQGDLFAAPSAPADAEAAEPHPALERLASLDPDAMSPREALDALYALRTLMT